MPILPALLVALAPQEVFELPRLFPDGPLLAAADFEGDGDLDLLQSVEPAAIRLLENEGNGVFLPRTPRAVAGAVEGDDLVFADLDGDGLADVACSSEVGGAELALHRGVAGGGFAAEETTAVPGVVDLALGDADGDGRDDVLVATQDALCWAQLGPGAWSFGPSLVAGTTILDVAVADLDGDGADDAAVSFVGSTTVALARTVAGAPVASGSFVAATSPAPAHELVAGDFDGDGVADLALGDAATAPVAWSVALGDGAFGFAVGAPVTFFDDLNPDQAAALDQDGDGDDDLVVGRGPLTAHPFGHTLVYLEADAGTLSLGVDATIFRSGQPAVPVHVRGAGDVDGDGRPDVLADEALVHGRGAFVEFFELDLFLTAGQLVDLEGDGDLDFSLENLRNRGDGTFEQAGSILPAPPVGEVWEAFGLTVADFDGDGLPDALAVSICPGCGPWGSDVYSTRLLPGNGTATFDGPGTYVGFGIHGRTIVDFDGDGDLDILATNGVGWENRLPQTFAQFTLPFPVDQVQDVGDVFGDGGLDFWCRGNSTSSNAPTLQFDVAGVWFELPLPVPRQGTLRSVDLDGDGDLDSVYKETTGELHLVETTPIGFGAQLVLESDFILSDFRVGDFDADGRPDFLLDESFRGFDRYGVHLSGGLPFPQYLPERQFYGWFVAAVEDIDADGDDDLVGAQLVRSTAHRPPVGATRLQEESGEPGTGGARPLLGLAGPLVPGETVELRLRQGLGGATAFLGVGTTPGAFVDVPFAGNLLLLGDVLTVDVITLGGASGVAATGAHDLPFVVGPSFAGLERHAQFFVVDPGAANGLLAGSNRLVLRFGQ